MLDLLLRQQILIINLHIYATYPLAECTECLVLNILLLFGGSPNDGKAAEGRDVPDFPNCEVPDVGIAESFFVVSGSFGGPIRSPITRLLLVAPREYPLAIFAHYLQTLQDHAFENVIIYLIMSRDIHIGRPFHMNLQVT